MPSLGEEGVFDVKLDHNVEDLVIVPDEGCFWGNWTRWVSAVIIVLVIILLRNLYKDPIQTVKKPFDEAAKVVDLAKAALLKNKAGDNQDPEANKDGEKKDAEKKDAEKKDAEKKDAEKKDADKKDGEKKDGEKKSETKP